MKFNYKIEVKKLDSELKDYKSQVDDLLKCKNDYKQTQV